MMVPITATWHGEEGGTASLAGRPGQGWCPSYFCPPSNDDCIIKDAAIVQLLCERAVRHPPQVPLLLHCCRPLTSSPSPLLFVDCCFQATNNGAVVIADNGIVIGATSAKDDSFKADKGVKSLLLLSCSRCHHCLPLSPLCCHPPTHVVIFLFVGCHLFIPPFVWLIVVLG